MTRNDRFIYKEGDVEIHRVTARAIAYDAARNPLREIEVSDPNAGQAAHRAIDELHRENWRTVEVTLTRG